MRPFIILFVVVLFFSGCKQQAITNSTTNRPPNTSQPIHISTGEGDAAEPAMAASLDGSVYVAWVTHAQDAKADVMFARLNREGQMQGLPVRINSEPGSATAWRGDPPVVAVGPDQSVSVSWTAKVQSESGHATDLYVSVSRDQGRTFAQQVRVNDDKQPAVHGMHSLTIGADGRVYVAWLDERNILPMPAMDKKMKEVTSGHHMESNREVFFASSADGGRTFSANKRVATNVCPCCKTSLATGSDGRVYLSWRQVLPGNFRHIAVASSTDQGQTFAEAKIVSDDQWMLAGCPVSGSTMIVSGDGKLHVLWYSAGKNGETGLYSSTSTDGGNSFDARTLVAKGEIRGTPVLLNNGRGLTAVWESATGKIMATMIDGKEQPYIVTDGSLPAAVATPANVVTAYIATDGQGQSISIISATP